MKVLTVPQLENEIEHIIHDEEELASKRNELFNGVSQEKIASELKRKLGENWVLKKEPPIKFTKEDIAAVANNRYFRKSGKMLLLAWAVIVMAFAIISFTFNLLPIGYYYILSGLVTMGFLYGYSKKQKRMREELIRTIYGNDKIEASK